MKRKFFITFCLFIIVIFVSYNYIFTPREEGIPKIIHKIYIENSKTIPMNKITEFKEAHESWKKFNPDYKIRYWSLKDCENYLIKHYDERHIKVFEKLKPYSYKCDFFKCCVIFKEGGWISDWKQETYISLDSIIGDYDFICFHDNGIPELNHRGHITMGLLGSIKNNPIIKLAIDQIIFNVENNIYGLHPLDPTGPYNFGKALQAFLNDGYNSQDNLNILFGVYESNFFSINNKIITKHKTDNKIYNQDWENGNNYAEMWYQQNIYN